MARYDESPPGEMFPGIMNPQSTGAPGTAGISVSDSAPRLADVPVSIPGASSQLPVPAASVNVGDTSAFSDDRPIHGGLLLGDAAGASATGAGTGSTVSNHPNAGH